MPLATPVIALVGFFSFTGNWNNYFLPLVTVPGTKAPIQVGLAELLVERAGVQPDESHRASISLSTLALATLISVAPVLIVFLFAQRFLVAGMTAGGDEGMKITGYRTLSTRHALAARGRRCQRAHRGRRHRRADPHPRDRRGHRRRRHRLARRHRPALPRHRGRRPAGRGRAVRPDARRRSSSRATPVRPTAASRTIDAALWDIKAKARRRAAVAAARRPRPVRARLRLRTRHRARRRAARALLRRLRRSGLRRRQAQGRPRPRCRSAPPAASSTTCSRRNTREPGLMLDANESWQVKQAVRLRQRARGAARPASGSRSRCAAGMPRARPPERRASAPPSPPARTSPASSSSARSSMPDAPDIVQAGAVWGMTHFLRLRDRRARPRPADQPGRATTPTRRSPRR